MENYIGSAMAGIRLRPIGGKKASSHRAANCGCWKKGSACR